MQGIRMRCDAMGWMLRMLIRMLKMLRKPAIRMEETVLGSLQGKRFRISWGLYPAKCMCKVPRDP